MYDFGAGGFDLVDLIYPEHDKKYHGRIIYDKFFSESRQDSLIEWAFYMENQFPHKWDLRDYPFDQQKLRFIFESNQDSSVLRLVPPTDRPTEIVEGSSLYLKDGLVVTGINTESEYIPGEYEDFIEVGQLIGVIYKTSSPYNDKVGKHYTVSRAFFIKQLKQENYLDFYDYE